MSDPVDMLTTRLNRLIEKIEAAVEAHEASVESMRKMARDLISEVRRQSAEDRQDLKLKARKFLLAQATTDWTRVILLAVVLGGILSGAATIAVWSHESITLGTPSLKCIEDPFLDSGKWYCRSEPLPAPLLAEDN